MGFEWHGSLSATRKNAHSVLYFYAFIIILFILLNKKCYNKKRKNMSAVIAYLINPHKVCYEMDKTSIFMFEILEPGGSALGKYSI